jgi:TRAP-type C4-dicarboxylate transport system permease small subunit
MGLAETFIIVSYIVGSIAGVIIWEVFLREIFNQK